MSKTTINQMVSIICRVRDTHKTGYYNGPLDQVLMFIKLANKAGLQVKPPTACPDIVGLYSVEVAA